MSNIIIIGASSGIGKQLALLYGASAQNKIGLLARRKEELTRIASQIQASTEIMHLDLESVDAAKEYRIFLERFSTIDTVIYCAGFG